MKKICNFPNLQNLLTKKKLQKLKNIKFWKFLKIGVLHKKKPKFDCSNNLKKNETID